jgi:hypothetical protein
MSDAEREKVEEMWVTISEAAKLTGYSKDRLQRIAQSNWNRPEAEREVTLKKDSYGYYLVLLPSIIQYTLKARRGPRSKSKHSNT